MSVFIGDFNCKADAKGRIVLPAAFKKIVDAVGETRFVVKKDLYEPCLVLYPYTEWENRLDKLREKINPYNKEHQRFLRSYLSDTAEVALDGNGRLLVPRRLMELVGAGKDLVMLGIDQYIELWGEDEYAATKMSSEEEGQLAEKLFGSL